MWLVGEGESFNRNLLHRLPPFGTFGSYEKFPKPSKMAGLRSQTALATSNQPSNISFDRYDSYLSNDMTIVEIESAFASNFKFHKEHHDDDDSYRAHRRDVLISHQNGDLSQHPTYHSIDKKNIYRMI